MPAAAVPMLLDRHAARSIAVEECAAPSGEPPIVFFGDVLGQRLVGLACGGA